MRVVELLRRVTLAVFVGLPVLVVVLSAVLEWLDAREDNPIVEAIHGAASAFTPEVLTTVLRDQELWQTVLLTLIAYALLAVLIVVIFAVIGRAVAAGGRRVRDGRERRENEAPPEG